MNNAVALKDKLASLIKEAHNLEGRRSLLIEQKAQILIELQAANHYLDHKDEVQSFLMEIQTEAQKKTKALFEDLLTYLIREVRPDNRDQIQFDTQIKNNKVALDINVKIDERSKPVNVLKDKGGSIQNITAMGLRFITVSRSRNRKIVLLDEADHWLPGEHVPTFAKIVRELSEEMGIQVIYISHHKPEAFIGQARIVKLALKQGHIQAFDDQPLNFEDDDIGIRSIRLKNFKKHTNTLINLDKYVTVITGAGDLGKSAVIEAFHTVMHNDGRDELIKDDSDKCNIEIGIEEGNYITYQYLEKGKSRTLYKLIGANGETIHQSTDGKNTPDWLDSYLACPTLSGLDIHTGTQRDSNFILDDKFTPQRRAEILSLENEAEQIQKMITLHAEKISFHRRNVTTLSKQLNDTKAALEKMELLSVVFDLIEIAKIQEAQFTRTELEISAIKDAGSQLAKCIRTIKTLRKIESITMDKEIPKLHDTGSIREVIIDLRKGAAKIQALSLINNVRFEAPRELINLREIIESGRALSQAKKKLTILRLLDNAPQDQDYRLIDLSGYQTVHEISKLEHKISTLKRLEEIEFVLPNSMHDVAQIRENTSTLDESSRRVSLTRSLLDKAVEESEAATSAVTEAEKTMGHCPLCTGAFQHQEECAHE